MKAEEIQQAKQRFGIIGANAELNRAIDVALQVAPTDLSVLITGESGVGKEVFPQIIHHNSPRKHAQYIAVNCGAIPEGTIDSELFGHEKGSFTDAKDLRKGYFEVADGGTIFLDEVGELPLSTQVRLLRVLESGEFMKVGSSKAQKTNVRIVAATNVNLMDAVSQHKFRVDLYYRLSTVPIRIPPLRERQEDVLLLFRKFAGDCADKYRMPTVALAEDARELLLSYRWPGNVRELKNIVERISVIEEKREISADVLRMHIPNLNMEKLPALAQYASDEQKMFNNEREILYSVLFDMKKDVSELKKLVHNIMNGAVTLNGVNDELYQPATVRTASVHTAPMQSNVVHQPSIHHSPIQDAETIEEAQSLEDVEKDMIQRALDRNNGRRKNAASDLKISERTLYRKIKEYDLE
ncbi:MAG: sigma-54 dependent transcriptional regulator [Tannerella sp.]|jgi:transcriptional regulator with PAS, ATPase and Fis domain|nr:sigma-54 dependent transcriptional regulator [Tannerella sp.]